MSKTTTIQKIKDNVYENVNNEITGQKLQDTLIEIVNDEYTELGKKQDKLVSGTNIKTIQGQTLLGSGNVALTAGSVNAYTKGEVDSLLNSKVGKNQKINDKPLSGDITLSAGDVGTYTKAEIDNKDSLKADKSTTYTKTEVDTKVNTKQNTLVSGTNIKTVNNTTLLGSGNVAVQPTLVSGNNIKTINGQTLLGSGDIVVGEGADVIDNLNSTSTTDALSANQGRILSKKIEEDILAKIAGGELSFDWNIDSGNGSAGSITKQYIQYQKVDKAITVSGFVFGTFQMNGTGSIRISTTMPFKATQMTYGVGTWSQSNNGVPVVGVADVAIGTGYNSIIISLRDAQKNSSYGTHIRFSISFIEA